MKTNKQVSDLINTAISPIIDCYPVIVDAFEGNDMPDECAWYKLTPTEQLTKDLPNTLGDLQVAIVCGSYDRALEIVSEVCNALKLTMTTNNVGVGAYTTTYEFSQDDMKYIAYISTNLNY